MFNNDVDRDCETNIYQRKEMNPPSSNLFTGTCQQIELSKKQLQKIKSIKKMRKS